MRGFNEARTLGVIAESIADFTNGDFEDSVADKGFCPDGVEKFFFGHKPGWVPQEVIEQGEGFGSELDFLCASPQALIGQVQVKGIEDDQSSLIPHFDRQTLPDFYGRFMTFSACSRYCLLCMEKWQYSAAFVIQFGPETNIGAGRFEGRVEHIASTKAKRFHSLDELLSFVASLLTEMSNSDQEP